MTERKKKVLVGMSGGTDSSAACLLLQEAGYEVAGVTMRVWDLPRQFAEGSDMPRFIADARALADRLGIAHYVADEREAFRQTVVRNFIDEYAAGRTPNPCVMCNPLFKFRVLTEWADRLGCDYIATGHYVNTETVGGTTYLLMGDDARKDQSYFLWRLSQETLRRCLFPLGGMTKTDVRAYLSRRGFDVQARQEESMEVCFVEGDYRDFLREQDPTLAQRVAGGWFVDKTGHKLGEHMGVPFYTVGQRKGLGIALGRPAYVLRLNAEKNTVILGTEEDLLTTAFFVTGWQAPEPDALTGENGLTVRIRYRSDTISCRCDRLDDGRLLVRLPQAAAAVTPGQSAVFYVGRRLVGGGYIDSQRGIGLYLHPSSSSPNP